MGRMGAPKRPRQSSDSSSGQRSTKPNGKAPVVSLQTGDRLDALNKSRLHGPNTEGWDSDAMSAA